MPPVVANSHAALEAAEFAREHGGFDAFLRALFHAYFEDARDIVDADVLCDVARACGVGVDDPGMRQAFADERYRDRIECGHARRA
jgi:predicted DsbA family dithiol-disulfide isomerase